MGDKNDKTEEDNYKLFRTILPEMQMGHDKKSKEKLLYLLNNIVMNHPSNTDTNV